jgi:hypothetical protein
MSVMPSEAREARCAIGTAEPVTLDFLMRDYVRHLCHHLAQILGPEGNDGVRVPL